MKPLVVHIIIKQSKTNPFQQGINLFLDVTEHSVPTRGEWAIITYIYMYITVELLLIRTLENTDVYIIHMPTLLCNGKSGHLDNVHGHF